MEFLATEFLRSKRDGNAHSSAELKAFVDGFVGGNIPDYQVAAWLMAVYFRGLSQQELLDWTEVMWKSGRSLRREPGQGFWIDKHSTGGVGDKTSLILVPLVSCVAERLFGEKRVRIPMISGRGLGFTGGTLDKLDSVPGFRSQLNSEEALALLQTQGFFMGGQSDDLAPADRRVYALRDVTATVESVPLIVSSILSKKLSESIDGLVMDVKFGKGANFQTEEEAYVLAGELMRVGRKLGLKMTSLLTRMDEPTGFCVGHSLEMEECAEYLSGLSRHPGLHQLIKQLSMEMLRLAAQDRVSDSDLEAEIDLELTHGAAHERFIQMLESQNGDWEKFLHRSRKGYHTVVVKSPRDGYIASVNARSIALLLRDLGGSRRVKEHALNHEVGIRQLKISGDSVKKGEPIAQMTVLPGTHEGRLSDLEAQYLAAVSWSDSEVAPYKWVQEIVRS